MNERIRELAIQAGMIVSESNGFDRIRLTFNEVEFAELIVRECVTICQYNADDDDQFDLGRVHKAKEIIHLIKKHFGVEL